MFDFFPNVLQDAFDFITENIFTTYASGNL